MSRTFTNHKKNCMVSHPYIRMFSPFRKTNVHILSQLNRPVLCNNPVKPYSVFLHASQTRSLATAK